MTELDTAQLWASLDAARSAHGLSWRELATTTGLSASTFSRLQHGQTPSVDGYVVICRWLGTPMETFVQQKPTGGASLDTELVALLHRHGLSTADQDFMLGACRTLTSYRAAQKRPDDGSVVR